MGFLLSNTFLKVWIGLAFVVGAVGIYNAPSGNSSPCVTISKYPNRSEVWQCPKGLNTAWLADHKGYPVFTTVSTDVQTEAWLTKAGDTETVKTIRKNLGAPVVLGPGAFMAVGTGEGLIYIQSKTQFLLTIAWSQNVPQGN